MNAGGESYSGMQHLFTFPWIRINPWRHNLFCCTSSKHGTIPHIESASGSKCRQHSSLSVKVKRMVVVGCFFFIAKWHLTMCPWYFAFCIEKYRPFTSHSALRAGAPINTCSPLGDGDGGGSSHFGPVSVWLAGFYQQITFLKTINVLDNNGSSRSKLQWYVCERIFFSNSK